MGLPFEVAGFESDPLDKGRAFFETGAFCGKVLSRFAFVFVETYGDCKEPHWESFFKMIVELRPDVLILF